MNKRTKLISNKLSAPQAADLITDATASFATTLPTYFEPIAGLLATGATFAGLRVVKMGKEVQEYIKSAEYLPDEENSAPYRKLYETLHFLSKNPGVDDEYIDYLRSLHIVSFSSSIPVGQLSELWFLLETTRKMSALDILIVLTAYRIDNKLYSSTKMDDIFFQAVDSKETRWVERWTRLIQIGANFSHPDFIYRQQELLEDLHLISARTHGQHSVRGLGGTFAMTGHCRLTTSGYKLAEYIIKGDELFDKMMKLNNKT